MIYFPLTSDLGLGGPNGKADRCVSVGPGCSAHGVGYQHVAPVNPIGLGHMGQKQVGGERRRNRAHGKAGSKAPGGNGCCWQRALVSGLGAAVAAGASALNLAARPAALGPQLLQAKLQ